MHMLQRMAAMYSIETFRKKIMINLICVSMLQIKTLSMRTNKIIPGTNIKNYAG